MEVTKEMVDEAKEIAIELLGPLHKRTSENIHLAQIAVEVLADALAEESGVKVHIISKTLKEHGLKLVKDEDSNE